MRVLRAPGFGLLLAGQSVNAIGNWVAIIAIWGFAAFRFDAGPGDIGLLFVVLSVPGAIVGPLLGVPIDRLGPRRTLILANGLGCVSALALAQADSYRTLILLAVPLGLIEALAAASLDALPPRLVQDEELVSANALLEGAQDVAIVVGPVVAALVNARWGLAGAFVTDAATFVVGLLVALPLDIGPAAREEEPKSALRSVQDGVQIARQSDGLRWTLAVCGTTYLLWGFFGVLEPLYVRDVLDASDSTFAALQAVFGVGLVGGGIVLAVLGDRMARPRHVAVATMISGATAALYLGTDLLPVAFAGIFLWGINVAFFYAPAKTLLQRYTPTAAHGRILSLNQSLEPLAAIVIAPVAAVAAGAVALQVLGAAGGLAVTLAGLVAFRLAHRLAPEPPVVELDPEAGTSRDAIALGAAAPM